VTHHRTAQTGLHSSVNRPANVTVVDTCDTVHFIIWLFPTPYSTTLYQLRRTRDRVLQAYVTSESLVRIPFGISIFVWLQVLMAARMKTGVCWVVAPCSMLEAGRRFRGAYCLHDQSGHLHANLCPVYLVFTDALPSPDHAKHLSDLLSRNLYSTQAKSERCCSTKKKKDENEDRIRKRWQNDYIE
jgi:hypothetical protein